MDPVSLPQAAMDLASLARVAAVGTLRPEPSDATTHLDVVVSAGGGNVEGGVVEVVAEHRLLVVLVNLQRRAPAPHLVECWMVRRSAYGPFILGGFLHLR